MNAKQKFLDGLKRTKDGEASEGYKILLTEGGDHLKTVLQYIAQAETQKSLTDSERKIVSKFKQAILQARNIIL